MEQSTRDQIEGALHNVKGTIKEKAGLLTDNEQLAAEGRSENLAGAIQKKIGQIEMVLER